MNNIELIKTDMESLIRASYFNISRDTAVHEKEIEMARLFINKLEALEKREIEKEKEFDKLMDNHQYLANEIDRLAEFIINNIEGEPSESEGAIDTAIRLLKRGEE